MEWRLHVATPATHRKLAALADLKAQLGISGISDDVELGKVIARRSAMMAAYCRLAADQNGLRGFGRETLEATFLATERCRDEDLLLPWRAPAISVTSVVEDGVTLDPATYRLHAGSAILDRLSDDGSAPVAWSQRKIVVTYVAGWICFDAGNETVPEDVQAACLEECKVAWKSRGRDPLLRGEAIPDVYQATYATPGAGTDTANGLLLSTAAALDTYRNPIVG